MMLFIFGLVYAVLHPVSIGNNRYVNQDPIIGACAHTAESAQKIMQKLIDTQAVQLDAYNSVFNRSDLFNGFTLYQAKVHEGYTIFNYSQVGDTPRVQYRFILSFVWEKAKQYTSDFIRETEQIIVKAFSALREAPKYFAKSHAPEKPKDALIAELKAQNPDHVSMMIQDPTDSINPVSMGNNQYVNKTPLLGACADTEDSARQIMQKLVETSFVQLDAYHTVFARSDLFSGCTIHSAKVHEGYTLFSYSRVGDIAAAKYRFILGFAWERAKQYTYDFIRATEEVVSKAFSALLGAPQYFIQHPIPEKPKVGFIDQLSSHLDRVRSEYTKVSMWNPAQIKSWKQAFIQKPIGYRNIHEMLAVLMRGAELSHGYVPRNVQILSVLSCLYQRGKGQFLQIKTSEGKTLITAMLAASKVLLEDIPVDVLSSSVVLAERDAVLQQKFYNMGF